MKIGDPKFVEFKQSLINKGANYETDEEYLEAFNNLVSYFDVLIEMDREQKRRSESEDDVVNL